MRRTGKVSFTRLRRRARKAAAGILTAATLLTLALTGCGSSSSKADGDGSTAANGVQVSGTGEKMTSTMTSSDAAQKKVLRVGIECAYAPYNWTQEDEKVANGDKAVKIQNADGYAYGYDVAVAQKIADQLGWKLEIYKSDWSAIFMGLNTGTYDCVMSGFSYSPERDITLDFSTPVYLRKIVGAVRTDSEYADYTSLSQFDGKKPKVTTQLGTQFVDYLPQVPSGEQTTLYETSSEAFLAVQNKAADMVVIDETTVKSALMSMSGLKELTFDDGGFKAPEGTTNDVSIAFREGDGLRDTVNEALKEINWTTDHKDDFDKLMDEMLTLQPNAN